MSHVNIRRRLAVTLVATTLTGCTIGPSTRTPLATYGERPAATSTAATSKAPEGPGGPGRAADKLEWSACPSAIEPVDGSTIDCAELEVPGDYSKSSGRRLRLPLARATPADGKDDLPPLVILHGDPGAAGQAQIADAMRDLPQDITSRYAVITIDLRGTVAVTTRMKCFEFSTLRRLLAPPIDPTVAGTAQDITDLSQTAAYNCGDRLDAALSDISSTNAADDLDTLRAALGQQRLSVIGQGFGATLGAVYAHRYPGRIDRLVLDGPADPSAPLSAAAVSKAVALDHALDDFAADCAARGADCPLGTTAKREVTDLIDHLEQDPESIDGVRIAGGSVLLLLSLVLGDPDRWPELADALAKASDGGSDGVDQLAVLLFDATGVAIGQLETNLAYRCNDAAERLTDAALRTAAAAAAKKAKVFGAFMVGQAALCGAWPTSTAPTGRLSAAGAEPILVIGSSGDPQAPYVGTTSLVNQLASASLITWQSGTAGSFPASSCVSKAVVSYLKDGKMPTVGALCPP